MPRSSRIIFTFTGVMALIVCTINLNTLRVLTNMQSILVDEPMDTKKMMPKKWKDDSTTTTNDSESTVSKVSFQNITSMAQAKQYKLTPVTSSPIHTSQYTIRMNTWRRNEQLLVSINHYAKCEGVAKIQIIWCDMDNEPPIEVINHVSGKVVVEHHTINSLNERYNITTYTPTLGILSMDDDVLRPCEALDATFIRWMRHPERIVGFYARSHLPSSIITTQSNNWTYNMEGPVNQYSMTLPSKMCFVHRDYLDLYVKALPRQIYQYIDTNFNCEDISMSYFVSALTGGKPPLLGDHWALKANMGRNLYSNNELSRKKDHADTRNSCVNDFAELLGLKEGDDQAKENNVEFIPLKLGQIKHERSTCFGYGDEPECWSDIDPQSFAHVPRLQKLVTELRWRESIGELAMNNIEWFDNITKGMEAEAKKSGLIKGNFEWDLRWSFKCPVYHTADKQTKYCAAIKPMKFRKDLKIPVCDITNGTRYHANVLGMTSRQYSSYLDQDLPCHKEGCADCLLDMVTSVNSCTVVIHPVNSTIETKC